MNSPSAANSPVFTEVKSFLSSCENLENGVIVGVSGGADSIALAHVLACQAEKNKISRLVIAHVNHSTRGAENFADELFVSNFTKELQLLTDSHLEFKSLKLNPETLALGASWEKNARVARYKWFSELAIEKNMRWVFTAHTSNDQAETVLMRILRGSGVKGLAGIRPKRPLGKGVSLGRPLLFCLKSQILSYLGDRNISWREDPSNLQTRFFRNKIRLELLPLLKNEYQPAIEKILTGIAGHVGSYADLENRLALKIASKIEKPKVLDKVVLDRQALALLPPWKTTLLLRSLFARESWPMDAIHHRQWKKIASNLGVDGYEVHLAGGIRIQSNRFTVVLGPV